MMIIICKRGMLRTRGKEGGSENKRERRGRKGKKRKIVCTKTYGTVFEMCVCLCSTYSSWIDNRISIPFIYMVASCPCVYYIGSPETNIMIRLTVSVSTLSLLFTIVHTFSRIQDSFSLSLSINFSRLSHSCKSS